MTARKVNVPRKIGNHGCRCFTGLRRGCRCFTGLRKSRRCGLNLPGFDVFTCFTKKMLYTDTVIWKQLDFPCRCCGESWFFIFNRQKRNCAPAFSNRHLRKSVLHGNCMNIQTILFRTEFRKRLYKKLILFYICEPLREPHNHNSGDFITLLSGVPCGTSDKKQIHCRNKLISSSFGS